jgi:hypothetical protein
VDFTQKNAEYEKFRKQIMTKKERRSERLKDAAYNPTTDLGKSVIKQGTEIETDAPAHLISTGGDITPGRGLLRVSVYKRTKPTESNQMVVTFISDGGSEVKIDAGAFFDGVTQVGDFQEYGYRNFLDMFHDKKIKTISVKDKRTHEDMLRAEIEKMNRWAFEEKNSVKYQIKSLESKLLNLKKRLNNEKNTEAIIQIRLEMDEVKKKNADLRFNTFEKEGDIDKEAAKIIGVRKRALKHESEVQEIMLCSWEIQPKTAAQA